MTTLHLLSPLGAPAPYPTVVEEHVVTVYSPIEPYKPITSSDPSSDRIICSQSHLAQIFVSSLTTITTFVFDTSTNALTKKSVTTLSCPLEEPPISLSPHFCNGGSPHILVTLPTTLKILPLQHNSFLNNDPDGHIDNLSTSIASVEPTFTLTPLSGITSADISPSGECLIVCPTSGGVNVFGRNSIVGRHRGLQALSDDSDSTGVSLGSSAVTSPEAITVDLSGNVHCRNAGKVDQEKPSTEKPDREAYFNLIRDGDFTEGVPGVMCKVSKVEGDKTENIPFVTTLSDGSFVIGMYTLHNTTASASGTHNGHRRGKRTVRKIARWMMSSMPGFGVADWCDVRCVALSAGAVGERSGGEVPTARLPGEKKQKERSFGSSWLTVTEFIAEGELDDDNFDDESESATASWGEKSFDGDRDEGRDSAASAAGREGRLHRPAKSGCGVGPEAGGYTRIRLINLSGGDFSTSGAAKAKTLPSSSSTDPSVSLTPVSNGVLTTFLTTTVKARCPHPLYHPFVTATSRTGAGRTLSLFRLLPDFHALNVLTYDLTYDLSATPSLESRKSNGDNANGRGKDRNQTPIRQGVNRGRSFLINDVSTPPRRSLVGKNTSLDTTAIAANLTQLKPAAPATKTITISTPTITPDPTHGLGLRLELLPSSSLVIVSSLKVDPSNGGPLAASRIGGMLEGDVVQKVNGRDLDGCKTIKEVIWRIQEEMEKGGGGVRFQVQRVEVVETGEEEDMGDQMGEKDAKNAPEIKKMMRRSSKSFETKWFSSDSLRTTDEDINAPVENPDTPADIVVEDDYFLSSLSPKNERKTPRSNFNSDPITIDHFEGDNFPLSPYPPSRVSTKSSLAPVSDWHPLNLLGRIFGSRSGVLEGIRDVRKIFEYVEGTGGWQGVNGGKSEGLIFPFEFRESPGTDRASSVGAGSSKSTMTAPPPDLSPSEADSFRSIIALVTDPDRNRSIEILEDEGCRVALVDYYLGLSGGCGDAGGDKGGDKDGDKDGDKGAGLCSASVLNLFLTLNDSSQSDLLRNLRTTPTSKLNWSVASRLCVPLWVHSSSTLKSLAQEIALQSFKQTKSALSSSLLFLASSSVSLLINLSKTDPSPSGKTLHKFLTDNDFATPHGAALAKKNAFSLLRKRKYIEAASFMLLPRPMMLREALEIIFGKVGDWSLAIMVGRLVEGGVGTETKRIIEEWRERITNQSGNDGNEKYHTLGCLLERWLGRDGIGILSGGKFPERQLEESNINFFQTSGLLRRVGASLEEKQVFGMELGSGGLGGEGANWTGGIEGVRGEGILTCKELYSDGTGRGENGGGGFVLDKDADNISHSNSIVNSFDVAPQQKKKESQPQVVDPMAASNSIFDSFDVAPQQKQKQPLTPPTSSSSDSDSYQSLDCAKTTSPLITPSTEIRGEKPTSEWILESKEKNKDLLNSIAASRLMRESCNLTSNVSFQEIASLDLTSSLSESLSKISERFSLSSDDVIARVKINNPPSPDLFSCRLAAICLLLRVAGDADSIEGMAIAACDHAASLCARLCVESDEFALGNENDITDEQITNCATQLELILWLEVGGCLILNDSLFEECIVAVRVCLLVRSWRTSNHQTMELLLNSVPDYVPRASGGHDSIARRNSSISSVHPVFSTVFSNDEGDIKESEAWAFLVDYTRAEADSRLKDSLPGTCIIRPSSDRSQSSFSLSFKGDDATYKGKVQHAIIRGGADGFRCGSFGPCQKLSNLLTVISDNLPCNLLLNNPPLREDHIVTEVVEHKPSPNCALFRTLSMKTSSTSASNPNFPSSTEQTCSTERAEQMKVVLYMIKLLIVGRMKSQVGRIVANKTKSRSYRILSEWRTLLDVKFLHLLSNVNLVHKATFLVENNERGSINVLPDGSLDIGNVDIGDSVIRNMIKPSSGVDFITERIGPNSQVFIVLFKKRQAAEWMARTDFVDTIEEGKKMLDDMAKRRVIENVHVGLVEERMSIDGEGDELYNPLKPPTPPGSPKRNNGDEEDVYYRFVDPWEVESWLSDESVSPIGAIGRNIYSAVNTGNQSVFDSIIQDIGGPSCLSLWNAHQGERRIIDAICSIRQGCDPGGWDLHNMYLRALKMGLERNHVFARMGMNLRNIAKIRVELLDLKNLSPASSSGFKLTAYSVLRLKRGGAGGGGGAPLNNKSRTRDSCMTKPVKVEKRGGVSQAGSWGSSCSFRFALPEGIGARGTDPDYCKDSLFRGPPLQLVLGVYEKRAILADLLMGECSIELNMKEGEAVEGFFPLENEKEGVVWFVRCRVSLNFELMKICDLEDKETRLHLRQYGKKRDGLTPPRSSSLVDLIASVNTLIA